MVKAGFNHVDNIIVEKTWLPGKRAENMLVNSHDYILFFVNGDVWKIDRTPIKQYIMSEESAPCCGNTWLVETGSLDDSYSDDLAELLLRFSDFSRIKWSDILDKDVLILNEQKTNKRREISIGKSLRESIQSTYNELKQPYKEGLMFQYTIQYSHSL
jgi:hypothetical protein